MDQVPISTIVEWARALGPVGDLEQLADDLRELMRGAEPPQPGTTADDAVVDDLPGALLDTGAQAE
ncbi:MAG: hypothetical protein QGH45_12210, partial [Myxococcota bacterium]|nr:hypothetical protein [Myxococcota bacterium]